MIGQQVVIDDSINANATHISRFPWGSKIRIRSTLQYPRSILAQEMLEDEYIVWRQRVMGLIGFLAGGGFAVANIGWVPAAALIGLFFMFILYILPRIPQFFHGTKRQMEYRGHMAEVIWNNRYDGVDYDVAFDREVRSIANWSSYKQFKGFSQAEIAAGMAKARPKAEEWVDENVDRVNKIADKVGL